MYFQSPLGLYLLYFLVPLIILYLIKAKPKEITIPSLIFFSQDKSTKKYNSILRKLLLRLLFFLQVLFIALIALSAATPIVSLPTDAYAQNTVVVMDISGSMATQDGISTKMQAGKEELSKYIKGKITIILAENNPIVLVSNISSSKARALLANLEPKDIPTRLDSSIVLASEMLGNEKGTIVVYSDFLLSKEDDILAAKKVAEANDKRVIFIATGKKVQNFGFVTLNLNQGKGEAFVKNYGYVSKTTDIRLTSSQKKDTQKIHVEPFSVERIVFDIPKGETKLEIVEKDALLVDNSLYVVNPYESKNTILYITNKKGNNPLLDALQSNPQFKVDITMPPVIPDLNYDLVVLHDIKKDSLLPNTFRDIKKYKDSGGKVILTAQDDLNAFDFQSLVDFKVNNAINEESQVCVDMINSFTKSISNPKCFVVVGKYLDIKKGNSSVVIASTGKGIPVFVMEPNLFYYGILDDSAGFKDQINYPIFWSQLVDYMLGKANLAEFNFKTGEVYLQSRNTSNKIVLDTSGIITIEERKIAVNMLNEEESDIYREMPINKTELQTDYQKINLETDMAPYVLMLALALFIFEIFYIKRRGDL